ncbi:hypothetical protein K504DRAFT_263558 [Pleomassaria siparia CBS 279.74]|uniref:BZIP domain-containing protein n=1 Tax=Pleomassaria siparia CBS 279.74 TaxID=1314801 RepID=A0A6G1KDP9_9PLEO|nr:hypothetical protein K504DRAFT_263558 [Pleomassaria siparia CBS 279.74]
MSSPHLQASGQASRGQSSASGRDSSNGKSEEWSDINDPNERRKIQNKLAQRRFRDKIKEQKEETEREAENQRRAGSSYASPEPREIDQRHELSGLPWGGLSMRHIVESGKSKEQRSQRSSGEDSAYATSRNGGSSRLGLRLMDQFARGHPAWRYVGIPNDIPTRPYFPYHLGVGSK